jgi:uncharacterized membrane protein HdeD (DUF308 family)
VTIGLRHGRETCRAAEVQNFEVQFSHDLIQYWGWFLALGMGLSALGVAAAARAVTATVVAMVFFGWLLVLAGAIEVVQAVAVGHWAGFFQHLFGAILFLVAGFIMVSRPLTTAEVLTLFMALFFLISGLFQLIGSAWIGLPGWGWSAVDGVITFVLGLLVLRRFPMRRIAIVLVGLAAPQPCLAAGKHDPQEHIPCGFFSEDPAVVRKAIPANHVTSCFGKPMTRDEAIKYNQDHR